MKEWGDELEHMPEGINSLLPLLAPCHLTWMLQGCQAQPDTSFWGCNCPASHKTESTQFFQKGLCHCVSDVASSNGDSTVTKKFSGFVTM